MPPPKPPGSFSSGAPSSDGASSAASHESMGILGRDGDGETDLLRGNSSSKKVRPPGGGRALARPPSAAPRLANLPFPSN